MVVLGVAHLDQRGLEVDVAGERVAADLDAVARGALDVEAAADLQRAQRRERQALLHHVEVGAVAVMVPDDGQAGAVAGDAGADLLAGEKAGRELQREAAQAGAVGEGRHGGDGLDDAGEHGCGLWKRTTVPSLSASAPSRVRPGQAGAMDTLSSIP